MFVFHDRECAQGSDLELHVCGDDTGAFVKNWVAAANSAQGQATTVCGELPICMVSHIYCHVRSAQCVLCVFH